MKKVSLIIITTALSLTGWAQTNTFPASGNVGIGTTAPAEKLEVKGNIRVADDADLLGIDVIQGFNDIRFAPTPSSGVRMTLAPNGNLGIGILKPTEKLEVKGNIRVADDADLFGIDVIQGFNDIRFAPTPSSGVRMTLAPNGNLGIGTTAPRHKLDVNGTVRAKEIRVEASPWPDFVFEKSYALKPLAEVERFIAENQHLPEIPSASEVEEKGIALGEMNAKLLQKVEELTLYIIGQQKEMALQSERIKTLENYIKQK